MKAYALAALLAVPAAARAALPTGGAAPRGVFAARSTLMAGLDGWKTQVSPELHRLYLPAIDGLRTRAASAATAAELKAVEREFEHLKRSLLGHLFQAAEGGETPLSFEGFSRLVEERAALAARASRVYVEPRRAASVARLPGSFDGASARSGAATEPVAAPAPAVAAERPRRHRPSTVQAAGDSKKLAVPSPAAASLPPAVAAARRHAIERLGASPRVADLVIRTASRMGVDPVLALAIVYRESTFRPTAYNSGSGAGGLMQLMADTARDMGVAAQERFDAAKNLLGGMRYLHWLNRHYVRMPDLQQVGDEGLSRLLVGWHAGPGNLMRNRVGPATRDFVAKVKATYATLKSLAGLPESSAADAAPAPAV